MHHNPMDRTDEENQRYHGLEQNESSWKKLVAIAALKESDEESTESSDGAASVTSTLSNTPSSLAHRNFGREESKVFTFIKSALEMDDESDAGEKEDISPRSVSGRIASNIHILKANVKQLFEFQQLESIEDVRRRLLFRTRHTGSLTIMHTYYGTVFQSTVRSLQLWFSVILYVTIRLLNRYNAIPLSAFPAADLTYTSVIGSFLTFFLVFFASESYSRYKIQYDISMRCQSSIFDIITRLRVALPWETSIKMLRFLNMAHVLAYCGLSTTYNYRNLFLPLNDIYKLATDAELNRLLQIGIDPSGSAYREVLSWCVEMLYGAIDKGIMSERVGENIVKIVLALRQDLTKLYEHADQPIPFFYLHLVFFISLFYIPLFSYTLAVTGSGSGVEITGLLAIFMNGLFILGIRESGYQFADPYGSDPLALSVMHYCTYTITMTRRLLASPALTSADGSEDEALMDFARPTMDSHYAMQTTCYKPRKPYGK
jgi:hypothetical protein